METGQGICIWDLGIFRIDGGKGCQSGENWLDYRAERPPAGGPRNRRRYQERLMFDRQSLENLFDELRDEYELEPDWEDIQRSAHLAVALVDAGQPMSNVDDRVAPLVDKHNPG